MSDVISRWINNRKPKKKLTNAELIEGVVGWMKWGILHESKIHYKEVRPIPVHQKIGLLPLTTDCSGFFTICYAWAGAPDPNGSNYSGSGFTGTLLTHGHVVTSPKPGDAVIFGGGSGHHIAGVIAVTKKEVILCSHGQESGPIAITLTEEAKFQPPGIRYRRFLV